MTARRFATASFFALALIAAAAWPAAASFFDATPGSTTAGPPYDGYGTSPHTHTSPIVVNVSPNPTGPAEEEVALSLRTPTPPELVSHVTALGGGGGGGGGGYHVQSFFDVFLDLGPNQSFPADSFFDVFVELKLPGGNPAPLAGGVTCAWGDSFFDVFFDVDIPGVPPQQIHGENPMAPLVFHNVHVTQGGGGGGGGGGTFDSFFDVFIELRIPDGGGGGSLPDVDPLSHSYRVYDLRLSDAVPEPAALGLLGLSLLALRKRRS